MSLPIPTIGVILLDLDYYAADELSCEPTDRSGLGFMPPGFLEHPASWACPTIYRVARGCSAEATAGAAPAVAQAVRSAAEALEGRVDVITTDCAYLWYANDAFAGISTPVISSSLAFLDLARRAGGAVAVVASNSEALRALMGVPPPGVRIVGLETKGEWARYHVASADMEPPLNPALMRDQLVERLAEDVAGNGAPQIAVLECTGLPQFRAVVQETYGRPVIDLVSEIYALTGLGDGRRSP